MSGAEYRIMKLLQSLGIGPSPVRNQPSRVASARTETAPSTVQDGYQSGGSGSSVADTMRAKELAKARSAHQTGNNAMDATLAGIGLLVGGVLLGGPIGGAIALGGFAGTMLSSGVGLASTMVEMRAKSRAELIDTVTQPDPIPHSSAPSHSAPLAILE